MFLADLYKPSLLLAYKRELKRSLSMSTTWSAFFAAATALLKSLDTFTEALINVANLSIERRIAQIVASHAEKKSLTGGRIWSCSVAHFGLRIRV